MSNGVNDKGVLNYIGAVSGVGGGGTSTPRGASGGGASWFEAMARAWGKTLDNQAGKIIELSNSLGEGANNPSQVAMLTANSQQFAFLSQSAATSQNSAAQAIETLAKRS